MKRGSREGGGTKKRGEKNLKAQKSCPEKVELKRVWRKRPSVVFCCTRIFVITLFGLSNILIS